MGMTRTGEAVDAAVLAAPIGVHGPIKPEIGAFVARDDGLRLLGGQRRLDAERLAVLRSGPAIVEHLRLQAFEPAGFVRSRGPSARKRRVAVSQSDFSKLALLRHPPFQESIWSRTVARPPPLFRPSFGIVEYDSDRMALAGPQPADAMAQVDAIAALGALDRPVVDGEHDGVALLERHDLRPALHARPLLGQHELAAGEVLAGLRQQDRDLQRECEIAIQVLVQAVEVAGHVLQQQRCWTRLSSLVALLQEVGVLDGIAPLDAHPLVPNVRDRGQARIECYA